MLCQVSVNCESMLGWIINAFEGAAHVAHHQGHDRHCQDHGQHVPTAPGTSRSKRQLTWINGSQGYSAETSGGLLMSISGEGAKAFAEEIFAIEGQPAWVIGTVEVVSNIVIGSYSFFGWCSFSFKHIFAMDINSLLRLAVERQKSWTIRRLSKCSWSLEANQDSWYCQLPVFTDQHQR